MSIQRIFKSVCGAIFYLLVYLMCQVFVGTVVSYMVSSVYSFIYTYSSLDSTAGTDVLNPSYFEEIMTAVAESTTKFVNDNIFLISIIASLFTLLVYFIIFKLRRKKFTEEVGMIRMCGLNYPIAFVLGISLNFLAVALLSVIPIPEKLMADYADASSLISENAMTPTAIIMTVLITPILEEVIFRGLVYSRLKRCMPMLGAMILSSFLFGVMHGTSIVWVTYASLLGFVLAWIYEKCGSLWAPILLHMSFNLMGMLTSLFAEDISPSVILLLLAASVPVSVVLIFVVNKRSDRKIEIWMPALETKDNEN